MNTLDATYYSGPVISSWETLTFLGLVSYSALAYCSDHQEELDQEIERQLEQVDRMRKAAKPTPLVDKLKAKKLI